MQLYHKDWDHHGGVKEGVRLKAEEIDRACMALITDLKQRGMFEETLVVWAGEFGRTPMSQGGDGRDHHNKAMSVWLAVVAFEEVSFTAPPMIWGTRYRERYNRT